MVETFEQSGLMPIKTGVYQKNNNYFAINTTGQRTTKQSYIKTIKT